MNGLEVEVINMYEDTLSNRVVEFREMKDGRILKYTTFKKDSKGKYPLYVDVKMGEMI